MAGLKKILFVCSGNTCRSPMAEAIFKKLLGDKFGDELMVSSAGVDGVGGMEASLKAREVMAEKGVDLSAHRSRKLTKEIIAESDLVLCMTRDHKKRVLDIEPAARGRVFTLREYLEDSGGADEDIPDPFGGPVDVYRELGERLEGLLRRLMDKIRRTEP